MIPIQTVNANCCKTSAHEANTYIPIKTKIVETDVPIDLLIVCQTLSSTILEIFTFFSLALLIIFSLILSKITITSLIPYAIIVYNAVTKIVFTWTVGFNFIQRAYTPNVAQISKISTQTTVETNTSAGISFLILPKANNT